MSAVRVECELRIMQVGAGTGTVLAGQNQGNNPGVGQSAAPGSVGMSQMLFMNDAQMVPGTSGSVTLANILTALNQIATDFAGAGTPLITAALLAQINGWNTGGE